jgi:hypothetical protein
LGAINMDANKFERNVKVSFTLAKIDVENFKNSVSDWILFLDENQRSMKEKINELESKLRKIETENEIFAE